MKTNYFILVTFVFLALVQSLLAQSLEEAAQLDQHIGALFRQGKYNEALPLIKRTLAIREKALGSQHPDTAWSLTDLAGVYLNMGDYASALPFYERSLAIFEKTLGPQHPDTMGNLYNIALVYQEMGDYSKALPLHERALEIREKSLGPQHPDTAMSIGNLALVYKSMGSYSKALPLFERSLKINEKSLGPQHPDTALNLNNLADVYMKTGDYTKALPLLERALKIREKSLGPQHPDTAASIFNLAVYYNETGDYVKAVSLNESALAILEKLQGPEYSRMAACLNNAGKNYKSLGDNEKAKMFWGRSLAIQEKNLGLKHPSTATTLSNLGLCCIENNEFSEALQFLKRSLAIKEEVLGSEHPETGKCYHNLAILYHRIDDYESAIACNERAYAIWEKTFGSEHPDTVSSLNNLAFVYTDMLQYTKSLPIFKSSFLISEKVLGPEHPETLKGLNNLANVYYLIGDFEASRNYVSRLTASKQKELQSILILDERTRLSWQNNNRGWNLWLPCVLDSEQLAELILTNKGVVLDSLAEDRALAQAAGLSGDGVKILQSIKSLQLQLSKMAFEKGKDEQSQKLQDEIGRLQRELTSKYLGRERKRASASITMADIVPALSGGGVLVDFIEFQDPKLKGEESTCFGAIITAEDNSPIFVRIDGGKSINRSIENLRSAINQGNAAEVEAQTKFLSEKLWQPVAAKIPEGAKRLFICPDANLNFLSFAALLESDGRFVAEKYPISYIGSARDLAKKPSEKISKSMAIFANPQFDAGGKSSKNTEMVAMRSAEADVFGSIALPPLPGTETEAQSLGSLATESGWNVKSALGKDATELSVRNTQKPAILHLATHGFYLNSFTPPAPEGSRGMSVVGVKETAEEKKKNEKGVDPMRASGVALTGAQNTLSSWSQRKAPDPETDGVLTAEEVGALRLDGTWMVVLSACETGVGAARSGEGVFGLRRAFMIAGAENLLMTLWPVADETTAKIMADFYKEAFATGDAAGSLAKVQRDWLVKIRNERSLLAAIREAGPFAMVVMTKPRGAREFVEGVIQENETTSGQLPATKDSSAVMATSGNPLGPDLPLTRGGFAPPARRSIHGALNDSAQIPNEVLENDKSGDSNVIKAVNGAVEYNEHLYKTINTLEEALKRAKSEKDIKTLNLIHDVAFKELKDLSLRIKKREDALTQIGWPSQALKSKYMSETEKSKSALSKLAEIISESTVVL